MPPTRCSCCSSSGARAGGPVSASSPTCWPWPSRSSTAASTTSPTSSSVGSTPRQCSWVWAGRGAMGPGVARRRHRLSPLPKRPSRHVLGLVIGGRRATLVVGHERSHGFEENPKPRSPWLTAIDGARTLCDGRNCSTGQEWSTRFGGRMASSGPGPRGALGHAAPATSGGRGRVSSLAAVWVVLLAALTLSSSAAGPAGWTTVGDDRTTTRIKHLVVLFQENVPFDRYFGVYPHALNPPGEPRFDAARGTPAVEGLTGAVLTANPNAAAPHRLDRTQPNVCGSNHGYIAEQRAVDQGRMDRFVEETGNHTPGCDPTLGMGYFDGNTVTAMWTYAQHFTINDNSFGTTYGPSRVGTLNLVSGQTHGAITNRSTDAVVDGTMIANVEPAFEDCPRAQVTAAMTGRNIGDLLNERHVTWGWFSDGFRPTSRRPDGSAVCDATATNRYGVTRLGYESGDEGFQYYDSTANPHHLP